MRTPESRHEWYVAHSEQASEYQRKYRAANRDRVRETARKYRAANRDRYRKYNREWMRKYNAAHTDRVRSVSIAGEVWRLTADVPEDIKELLLTLKQTRQAIRNAKRGTSV
jgi:hypothetical protein